MGLQTLDVERLRALMYHHRAPLAAIGIALVFLSLTSLMFESEPARAAVASTRSDVLELPATQSAPRAGETPSAAGRTEPVALPAFETTAAPAAIAEAPPALLEDDWTRVKVRRGQTLAAIFDAQGLTPRDVHEVVHLSADTKRLTKIYPGDELAFRFADDGALTALEIQLDEATRLRVERAEDGYASRLIAEELVPRVEVASGRIESSLFLAGRDAGLTDSLIMEMAGLFGWDIDFVLDIRSGDSFHVIYEEIWRNGEYLRTGDILAATFVNQGRKFQAVRFETEHGQEYFAPDGRNMKKAFLRAPLNFSYISSNFNPKRFHPILKRYKPHNGIDYRAPSGTPVFSAGNGKVVEAGYGKYNGNYVFIQHGNNIITKYLHFSKKTVKRGQRVTQGQVIGYVGATGLAQAPHLHYEFVVNGVHRNPRTVDLPKADPLPDAQLATFRQHARPFLDQLMRLEESTLIAMAE